MMKKGSVLNLTVLLALAVLLAAGCAKKPAPEPTPAETPVAIETPAQDDARGVQEQPVTEAPVTDQQAAPAAVVAEMQRIFYDFDQYTLSPQARQTLAANAEYLRANPRVSVQIEGHCDERGSDEYNLALGERRARAARDYLLSLGIAGDRLTTISYGEERPLEPGSSEAAWAKNRRAEFVVR